MKKTVLFGAALVALVAEAKLVNLSDWAEARLGSREAVYACVTAESSVSGRTPAVLFDGVTYTDDSSATGEWQGTRGASVIFALPDTIADADLPSLDRYTLHFAHTGTYTWQASPTQWTLFGRHADTDEWTEIEDFRHGFYHARQGGQTSPADECTHLNALKTRATYRQYRLTFHETIQQRTIRLKEIAFIVDDGTVGRVIRAAADGTGDGSAWASAADLQTALSAAEAEDEIWLKEGTYSLTEGLSAPVACSIYGGFRGDEATRDARAGTARSVLDATAVDVALTMTDVEYRDYRLDRVDIVNAILRGVQLGEESPNGSGATRHAGAGLRVTDCRFAHNGTSTTVTTLPGRGCYLYGVRGTPCTFDRCVFDKNQNLKSTANRTGNHSGFGIYAYATVLRLKDCSFTDNGLTPSVTTGSADGRDNSYGSAIFSRHASIVAENCLFRGNRQVANGGRDGSTIYISGLPGVASFNHCLFVANSYAQFSQGASPTIRYAAQDIETNNYLGCLVTPLEIDGCTFAYNIGTTCGGIRVEHGPLQVRNSIFFGNFMSATKGVAADIELVEAKARADIAYTLFSASTCIGGVGVATLGDGVVYGDPLFRTSLAEVATHVRTAPVDYPLFTAPGYFDPSYDLSTIDVHVAPRLSPAIDAGDPSADCANEPAPNGNRLNLGYYGNTAEAAISSVAVPVLTSATIAFVGDCTKPSVSWSTDVSDEDYQASAYLCYGYEKSTEAAEAGWAFVDSLSDDVHPGTSYSDISARHYLEPGKTIYWRLIVKSPKATVCFEGPEDGTVVTGVLPPYWGKGLGADYIHVRADATGTGDGTSWLDAAPTMGEAYALVSETRTNLVIAGTVPVRSSTLVSLNVPVTISGGFTGEENAFAERTTVQATIDGEGLYPCLKLVNASGCTRLDGICFTRSVLTAVSKSGAGDLTLANCRFFACGDLNTSGTGRSLKADGASAATLTIDDCVFDRNWYRADNVMGDYSGAGGYLTNFKAIEIADTLYATNGYDHATSYVSGRDSVLGTALYINNAPLTLTNCRFVGNRYTQHNLTMNQAAVLVTGNSPTVLRNCLFAGNAGYTYSDNGDPLEMKGTVIFDLDATTRPISIENCTFAYNLGSRSVCSGLCLKKGAATIRNSIFFRNQYNTNLVDKTFGADLFVRADASADVAWTSLTGLSAPWVLAAGQLTLGEGVTAADPLFVSTADEFLSRIASRVFIQGSSQKGIRFLEAGDESFNLHVRGRGGYTDETTGDVVVQRGLSSPAIDAGDPSADFSREPEQKNGRLNLGFYGNTPWATRRYDPTGLILVFH